MSTIKVNKIENTSTTAGGVAIDSSGHVQVDGLQMPTAGALSNRNLIINGAMNVAQRGTTATNNEYGTVDRFKPVFSGGAQTQTQETLTSGSPYNEGFRKFLRLTNTTASTNAADRRQISYLMEGLDIANSGWNYKSSSSYITLSFWVQASVTQSYYVAVYANDGTSQTYTFEVALTENTWTKIEKTIPGNSNITLDNDNGAALQIDFYAFFGTDFTDSAFTTDAWATYNGSSRTPDFTTTWGSTAGATFDLTGVQLEVGEKATPFEHRSYGDELAKCQRYYWRGNLATGLGYSSQGANIPFGSGFVLPVTMRAIPAGAVISNVYATNSNSGTVYNESKDGGTYQCNMSVVTGTVGRTDLCDCDAEL